MEAIFGVFVSHASNRGRKISLLSDKTVEGKIMSEMDFHEIINYDIVSKQSSKNNKSSSKCRMIVQNLSFYKRIETFIAGKKISPL